MEKKDTMMTAERASPSTVAMRLFLKFSLSKELSPLSPRVIHVKIAPPL
jgi:hypothetical protein